MNENVKFDYSPQQLIDYIDGNSEEYIKNVQNAINEAQIGVCNLSNLFKGPNSGNKIYDVYDDYMNTLNNEFEALKNVDRTIDVVYEEAKGVISISE